MLDLIMNQVLDKEKVMHNRVGLILTSRVQKYCPMIKELEYSKKGRDYVKVRNDVLLNLKSTGLKARRMAGGDAGMEITKKILEINKKNKTTKNTKEKIKK